MWCNSADCQLAISVAQKKIVPALGKMVYPSTQMWQSLQLPLLPLLLDSHARPSHTGCPRPWPQHHYLLLYLCFAGRMIVSQGPNTVSGAFSCLLLPASSITGTAAGTYSSAGRTLHVLNRNRNYYFGSNLPSRLGGYALGLSYRVEVYTPAANRRAGERYNTQQSAIVAAAFGVSSTDSEV